MHHIIGFVSSCHFLQLLNLISCSYGHLVQLLIMSYRLSSSELKRYNTKSCRQKGSDRTLIFNSYTNPKLFSKVWFIKNNAKVYLHEFDMAPCLCFRPSFAWLPQTLKSELFEDTLLKTSVVCLSDLH